MTRLSPLSLIFPLLAAFMAGWGVRDLTAERDRSRYHAAHTQAMADALRNARAIEQQFTRDMETLQHDTQAKIEAIATAERRAADERVRDLAAAYAARHRPATDDPANTRQCEATAAAADMLAGLLGELDALAESYAADADRRRIAGSSCEAAFERLRQDAP